MIKQSESPSLENAKRLRRACRRALVEYEKTKSPEAYERMCMYNRAADSAYLDLSAADSAAYRRWAFATSPEAAESMVIKVPLRVVN